MNTMLSDFEFRLRTRFEPESPEAILINYLNSKATVYPSKDMAMIALMSYWMPLAYRSTGKASPDRLEQSLRDCIYRLQLHLQYLQAMLGQELSQIDDFNLIKSHKFNNFQGESRHDPTKENRTKDADGSPLPKPHDNQLQEQPESLEWFNPLKSK